jgi:hypothetical protein
MSGSSSTTNIRFLLLGLIILLHTIYYINIFYINVNIVCIYYYNLIKNYYWKKIIIFNILFKLNICIIRKKGFL